MQTLCNNLGRRAVGSIVAVLVWLGLAAAPALAQSQIPFFIGQLNQLSDNAAEYLINADGGGDVTLDVGDRLRGHFRIETIEDLTGGGGTYDVLNSVVELTAIFDVTVASKVATGVVTPFGPTYTFVFVPTPGGLSGTPGPAPPVGTMVRFFEDAAKDFTRLLSGGATDDGDPGLTGADIGAGPFATEAAVAASATGGLNFWDLGFAGNAGEGWIAVAIDNILVARGIAPPGNGGTVNIALNVLQNYIGPLIQQVPCTLGGPVDVCGSSNVLGIAGAQTPYDVFNNVDFAISPVEANCCVDIEKEINVDGVWYDHDLCADAPVVPAPHSGEYRLIVTNCGNTVLTSVQINDPTLGIVSVPIADLAPGETRTLTSGDIPALGTQEICMNAGEFPNTASITADCADGPVPSVSDEDSSCLVCEEEELGCRLTGGGVTSDGNWDGTYMDGEDGTNTYQLGGQAGANTALPPQPKGEWEHHQQKGPAGSFSFHAGTASAPAGTEVVEIRCSDPGGCTPSGNPPSPNKQLDFDCVGTFSNIGSGKSAPTWLIAGANVTAEGHGNKTFNGTFHYCEVNVDDLGEGPGPAEPDTADCPSEGFGEKGDPTVPANCDCPDFYRITIYDGVNAADVTFLPDGSIDPTTLNKTDVIYEVDGYLKNGNGLQLHSLTGFDTN